MIKKILNPIAKTYVNRTLNKRGNLFKAFIKKKQGVELPPADKGVIFLGPIRMSAEAHVFEGILGYAYRLKGYKVYAVMCGQKLTDCETLPLDRKLAPAKCATCFVQQKMFCEAFDIEPLYLGDFISKSEEKRIEEGLSRIDLDQMTFEGIDLTSHVTSGIMRVLKTSQLTAKDLPLVKRFAKTTLTTMIASANMMQKFNPKHCIMSHGTYSTWGGLILAAEKENVHAVVWGRGYVGKGNIYAANDGSYLRQNIFESPKNFEDVELNEEVLEKVMSYFNAKRNPKNKVDYISYYNADFQLNNEANIREELSIPADKKIIGMFPNIPWDGQAFSYSESFPTIRSFITTTLEWFKNREEYLVIRAHPAELHNRSKGQIETFEDILNELYPTLPENVQFLPPNHHISSYKMEEIIEGALLYGGTIGLEFSINKTTVIQTGKNALSNKGLLFEPESKEDYIALLEKLCRGELKVDEEMHDACLKFAYHWIYRRHFPETTVEFGGPLEFKGYQFEKADEILENEMITQFIDCVENRRDFVYHPPKDN